MSAQKPVPVDRLIELLAAAGYKPSEASPESRLEGFDPQTFCELYLCEVTEPVRSNAALGGAIEDAVRAVLKEGIFPEYRVEDDRGLEEVEYIEFVKAVLGKLVDQTAAEENLN